MSLDDAEFSKQHFSMMLYRLVEAVKIDPGINIDRVLDRQTDKIFKSLVCPKDISEFTVVDMYGTLAWCALILDVAKDKSPYYCTHPHYDDWHSWDDEEFKDEKYKHGEIARFAKRALRCIIDAFLKEVIERRELISSFKEKEERDSPPSWQGQ